MRLQLLTVLLLLACSRPAAALQAAPSVDPTERARSLVGWLAGGEYDRVVAEFSDTMRTLLPAPRLAQAWSAVQAQAGAFRGVRGARVEGTGAVRTVVLSGDFERVPLDVRVAVGADGRVVGLFFVPSPPAVPPDYSAPVGAPYRAEEVAVPTPGGFTLAGTLTLPREARGPVPAVVLISGSGPQDRDSRIPGIEGYRAFRQIADTLGRRGIAVLRLDDRGSGRSGGKAEGSTSADFADDVRAAVAYLRGRGEIAPDRIALAGHSEGGIIAPMVAASDPRIRAVVLMAAQSWTGRRVSDYQLRQAWRAAGVPEARMDSLARANDRARDSVAAQNPWVRFFLDHDPLPTVRRVKAPVLILQGATDRQVTAEQAPELAAALRAGGNRDVTVRVLPDVNHLFLRDPVGTADPARYAALPSKEMVPEALGALADWLAAKLR
jgi:hypothetical protein